MNLYPQDLGERIGEHILRQRPPQDAEEPSQSMQALVILCIGSLVATAIAGVCQLPISALFCAAVAVTAILFTLKSLRSEREQEANCEPITDHEIAHLWKTLSARDPLMRAYLKVVRAILAVPAAPETTAEQEVRGAVCALATAIESLPPLEAAPVSNMRPPLAERLSQADDLSLETGTPTDDPAALRAEAQCVAERAVAEHDPIIRASLQRRAESLTRRAETAARTLMLLRRNQALREEIAEQISALRTNVTAFIVGGRQSAQDFVGLAARIQRVTEEANALTTARAEVDSVLMERFQATEVAASVGKHVRPAEHENCQNELVR